MWTSLEIGIKFDKPTNIRSQLDKIANGGKSKSSAKQIDFSDPSRKSSLAREPLSPDDNPTSQPEDAQPEPPLDPTARFAALKSFYKNQISLYSSGTDSASTFPTAADIAYASPASLARIVSLYTNRGTSAKKPQSRAPAMREALTPAEGLLALQPLNFHTSTPTQSPTPITHLRETASLAQVSFQQSASGCGTPHAKLVSELRPMPALLRTKRARRCAACKHILVKPEFKPTSTRYRIKLTALNYIPLVTLRPLAPTAPARAALSGPGAEEVTLQPHRPHQWVLTLKNHLFDSVKVSLGTPAVTPGRLGHRVTVLCPQFEVGANSDVWDDALGVDKRTGVIGDVRREFGVAEAGKVYDKGRNWTSVVLEVVPVAAARPKPVAVSVGSNSVEQTGVGTGGVEGLGLKAEVEATEEEDNENEDDNVVEIPIRVRLEWRQSDADEGEDGKKKSTKVNEDGEVEDTARRELAYWMVLGVGRVGS
jgi:dynactin 4